MSPFIIPPKSGWTGSPASGGRAARRQEVRLSKTPIGMPETSPIGRKFELEKSRLGSCGKPVKAKRGVTLFQQASAFETGEAKRQLHFARMLRDHEGSRREHV